MRLKNLLASIDQFNLDHIPFYISTPEEQREELIQVLGNNDRYHWVSDESIIASNPLIEAGIEKTRSGSLAQQAIKSEFWRLKIAENYVCLDSDCVFIRDFGISDFLASDGNPYTVIYQNKEFFQLAINRGQNKIPLNLHRESDIVKTLFGRTGPNYYCHCPPFIWSAQVWRSLDEQYLQPKKMSFWDISSEDHPETLLYLEALLAYKAIPLHPIEQLFRIYYYSWQFFLLRRNGERQHKLLENYLGVIHQSNWNPKLDFGLKQKSFISRCLRSFKRFFRFLQAFT